MKRLLPLLVAVCVALALAPVADAGAPAPNPPPAPPPQGPIYEPAATVPVLLDPDTILHGDAGGYFPGASEVTPTGQLAWHTRVIVPPGLAEPSLSITYNSGGGNGLLGVGFSLAGLSEINRCGQVFAIDKKATPADHTENSRFCIDGSRLVVIKGAYGEDGSEYRTEEDGFSKVVYKAGSAGTPSSFTVWTKDGHSARYEALRAFRAAPSAVAPFAFQPVEEVDVAWPLVETSDRAENRIRYHYKTIATKRSLLKTINRCDADANCQWGKRFECHTDDRPDLNMEAAI